MALFTTIGAVAGGALAGAGLIGGTVATGALVGAGVGLTAGSQYYADRSSKQNAAFNRDVQLTNKKISEQNAEDVELRGRTAIYDQRRAVAREVSEVRAAAAASGLVIDEVGTTPQEMVEAMNEAGELDVLRLRNNIDREVRRALVQGAAFEAQAGQFELQRQSISPFRGALTAGASVALSPSNADILFG